MLMSLDNNSMAARMFCCNSARWVTTKVASIPDLKSVPRAAITIRPKAIETISSISVNPLFRFSLCISMALISVLTKRRHQCRRRVRARRALTVLEVLHINRDLPEIRVGRGRGARLHDRADQDLTGKASQAYLLVVS